MTPLLLAIPMVVAAPVPKDFKKEVPAFEGEWQLAWHESNGRKSVVAGYVWVFGPENITVHNAGRTNPPIPIAVDTKTSPMSLDFRNGNGGGRAGIFRIEGDTLTLCLSSNGTRPTEFESSATVIKYNFTRVAK